MTQLIGICAVFMVLHFAVKWLEARQSAKIAANTMPGLFDYIRQNPAYSLVAVVGTVAMFMLAQSMEWLNAGMAAACGYGGSDLAKRVVKQYENFNVK